MSANKFTDSDAPSSEGVSQAGNNNEGTAFEATSVTNLLNLTPDDALIALSAFMSDVGEPAYRARQVHRHLWMKPVASFEEMSDVPKRASRPARTTVLAAATRDRHRPAVERRHPEVPLSTGGWSGDRDRRHP